jgi:hypothetical protein
MSSIAIPIIEQGKGMESGLARWWLRLVAVRQPDER